MGACSAAAVQGLSISGRQGHYNDISRDRGDASHGAEKEENMIEIGRLCVKIAGRDAGKRCVVVEVLDKTFALIDGETRRRRCNILHLEPQGKVIAIEKGASHESVIAALEKEGIASRSTKPKQQSARPLRKRGSSAKVTEPEAKGEKSPSSKAAGKKKASETEKEESALAKPAKKPATKKKEGTA